VAERLSELGEVEKAKALFAEGLRLANQMTNKTGYQRAFFAAQLARVDASAAQAIAKEFKGVRVGGAFRVTLGLRMMEQDPAEALWFWKEMHGIRNVGIFAVCARLPMSDPARAHRFFDRLQLTRLTAFRAECYVFLALGLKARDEPASRQAMDEVLRAFDGLMQERPEQLNSRGGQVAALLPAVERIDPALVPKVFWRYVASRPPFANPRATIVYSPSSLIQYLAWYDRDVAAALFETSRERIERTEDRELASWASEFEAWASFDPHGAVARLEKLPVGPDVSRNDARIRVAGLLGFSHEQYARTMWSD
jgi:hypothetical protein